MNAYLEELTEKKYEELLDEIYEPISIGYLTYHVGWVLRAVDPIAFRCFMLEEPERWHCGECDTLYMDDEDAAEECCKEED